MTQIGFIGAGNMGSGIVQKIAQEGIPVVMIDIKQEFVDRGMNNIKSTLQEGVERKIFKRDQVDAIMSRITATTDLSAVADADIVIEAVFEEMPIKQQVFAEAEVEGGETLGVGLLELEGPEGGPVEGRGAAGHAVGWPVAKGRSQAMADALAG